MADRQQKPINIDQVSNYLTRAFNNALLKAFPAPTDGPFGPRISTRNHKGTPLYKVQVEFMYMLDEIQRGPTYITPKLITKANDFIDEVSRM